MKHLSQRDRWIGALENNLALARLTVILMTGEETRHTLLCPSELDSVAAVHYWFRDAMEAVLALAKVSAVEELIPETQRAICPLCGESNQEFNGEEIGFVYPEGLRHHLLGNHGSVQCGVSKIALDYALSSISQRRGWHGNGSTVLKTLARR